MRCVVQVALVFVIAEEVMAIAHKIDEHITEESVQELFQAADQDGSGIIDFGEFYSAVVNHRSSKV
eukprot:SAG11_NODE_60_length_19094_cov_26.549566_16_plen_66_part_00